MTYKGIVKGNTIILEESAHLADGTEVQVFPINQIDPFCGSWDDNRSADEIINDIRSSRKSRDREIEL